MSIRANAGALSAAEAEAVLQVIVAQMQAFAEDDADRAFEIATPGVREAIGSSGLFLAMVRHEFPARSPTCRHADRALTAD